MATKKEIGGADEPGWWWAGKPLKPGRSDMDGREGAGAARVARADMEKFGKEGGGGDLRIRPL